ncbi:hypothetical protein HMPREF3156_01561, partial [Neisseria sp. HMSC06F02]
TGLKLIHYIKAFFISFSLVLRYKKSCPNILHDGFRQLFSAF